MKEISVIIGLTDYNGLCNLTRCDPEEGCVCKDGLDCEGGTQFIDFASLSASQGEGGGAAGHARAVSIVATVLLLALVITVLAVLYYRRRMRRMQKDLEHRCVCVCVRLMGASCELGKGFFFFF